MTDIAFLTLIRVIIPLAFLFWMGSRLRAWDLRRSA